MQIAIIIFALTALGGLALVGLRLRGDNPPMPLALVHGVAGAAGLIALALPALSGGLSAGAANLALGLFVVAALGGFALFASHLSGKLLPLPLMFIHAIVAVAAFALLLLAAFG